MVARKKEVKKTKNWVDFREIKEKVSIAMVLEHYQVELKQSGKSHVCCCPIHEGTNPKQFSVNKERNIWKCFGDCQAGGNTLDLVAAMEGGISIHDATLKLKNWFLDDSESKESKPKKKKKKKKKAKDKNELVREEKTEKPEGPINPPLAFELKTLEAEHSFFTEQRIEPVTVEYFGLGYCSKGMMANRIAIPIHDQEGRLIAYCGRAVTKELAKEEGKYKLPSSEKGFYKSYVLYNLHRQTDQNTIIMVESFKTVWYFFQLGITNVVTPLGSSVSAEQIKLLTNHLKPNSKIIMMFDDDKSGQAGTEKALVELAKKFFVRVADISEYATKPHQLTKEHVDEILNRIIQINPVERGKQEEDY